jgi:MHS family proline/betaine transporter-like MFS transporter
VLFVIFRLLQGFSSGGEWGGAVSFLVEYSPPGQRGLFGGLQQGSVGIGLLAASAFGAALGAILGADQVAEWGWRVPFLFGGLLAPIGYFIRKRTNETPAYMKSEQKHEIVAAPVRVALRTQPLQLAQGSLISAIWLVAYYVYLIYMPTFAMQELKIPVTQSFLSNAIALAVITVCAPLFGALSDRIGRKPVLVAGTVVTLLAAYPMFWCLTTYRDFTTLLWVQALASAVVALFAGPGPTFLCELFPTKLRYTSVSLSYNLSVMVFASLTPVGATLLIQLTKNPIAPVYLVIACAAVALIPIAMLRDRFREPLT